jgi:nucleoside 2-deoxyribosyltransferase
MKLDIVGGFYREVCSWPVWSEFYGSGGRAAAALQLFDIERHLHTCASAIAEPALKSLASTYNFGTSSVTIPNTVAFRWFHPLSYPQIFPPLHQLSEKPQFRVTGDCVLRFGMLDADPIVEGTRVVYDPQSAFEPVDFHSNGSTAKELALVANLGEARRLTKKTEVEEIGAQFLRDGVVAAVIKNGAYGATAFEGKERVKIPAFKTKRVFRIGSGDIFSAVFALYWGLQKKSAGDAARLASLATSFYCENGYLPLPPRSTGAEFPVIDARREPKSEDGKFPWDIYLAGPFFNIKQLWLIEELRRIFRGFDLRVFSPFHNVGRGAAQDVAPADLEAIHKSRLVFACVDDLDSGTLFEIGYARARDIPVVGFYEQTNSEDLKMLQGTGCVLLTDFVTSIYTAVWQLLELRE